MKRDGNHASLKSRVEIFNLMNKNMELKHELARWYNKEGLTVKQSNDEMRKIVGSGLSNSSFEPVLLVKFDKKKLLELLDGVLKGLDYERKDIPLQIEELEIREKWLERLLERVNDV